MKFKKLNEHTMECFISKQDLADYGITIEDILKNPDKINDFVHKVVSLSQQEIDFQPNSSVLQAQIMPCEEGIVMIVFDKPTEKLGEYFLSQIKKKIKDAITGGSNDNPPSEEERKMSESFMNSIEEFMKEDDEPALMKEALNPGEDKCFMFASFEDLMSFIKACEVIIPSSLYYQDKTYFLIINGGCLCEADYDDLCDFIEEYGYMSADCDSRITLIKEHTKPLIAKNAIEALKNTL